VTKSSAVTKHGATLKILLERSIVKMKPICCWQRKKSIGFEVA